MTTEDKTEETNKDDVYKLIENFNTNILGKKVEVEASGVGGTQKENVELEFIGNILVDKNGNQLKDEKIEELKKISEEKKNKEKQENNEELFSVYYGESVIKIGQTAREVEEILGKPKEIEKFDDFDFYKYDSSIRMGLFIGKDNAVTGIMTLNSDAKIANSVKIGDELEKIKLVYSDFEVTKDDVSDDIYHLRNEQLKLQLMVTTDKNKIMSVLIQKYA